MSAPLVPLNWQYTSPKTKTCASKLREKVNAFQHLFLFKALYSSSQTFRACGEPFINIQVFFWWHQVVFVLLLYQPSGTTHFFIWHIFCSFSWITWFFWLLWRIFIIIQVQEVESVPLWFRIGGNKRLIRISLFCSRLTLFMPSYSILQSLLIIFVQCRQNLNCRIMI